MVSKYVQRRHRMRLRDCVPPEWNPRRISDGELEKLVRSIEEFGYQDPLIVNQRNNHIVCGNQRFRALNILNKRNHGKYTLIDVNLVDLDENEEKAFNIAHNKIGGEFDDDLLDVIMGELEADGYDLSLTGFYDGDVSDLDEFVDEGDEDLGLEPGGGVVGDVEYVLTVKLASREQCDFLFKDLRRRGYKVKSTCF